MDKQEFEEKKAVLVEEMSRELSDKVLPPLKDELKVLQDTEASLIHVGEQRKKHQATMQAEEKDIVKLENEVRANLQAGQDNKRERKKLAELKAVQGLNDCSIFDKSETELKEKIEKAKNAVVLEGQKLFVQNQPHSVGNIYAARIAELLSEVLLIQEAWEIAGHEFCIQYRLISNEKVRPTKRDFLRQSFKQMGFDVAVKLSKLFDLWKTTMQYAIRDLKNIGQQQPSPPAYETSRENAIASILVELEEGKYKVGPIQTGMPGKPGQPSLLGEIKTITHKFEDRNHVLTYVSRHLWPEWETTNPEVMEAIDKKWPKKDAEKKEKDAAQRKKEAKLTTASLTK